MDEPIARAEALIKADPVQRAAYTLGAYAALRANGFDRPVGDAAAAYLLLADAASANPLPRARDIAARVADLDALNLAHPGMWSQEQVSVERERLLGEIGRLMGGREWAPGGVKDV